MLRFLFLAFTLAAPCLTPALAADPNLARNLAATCASCHGPEGVSKHDKMVSLAGISESKILRQFKRFRDGTQHATVMHQISKGYTDAQIEMIAKWYAIQK